MTDYVGLDVSQKLTAICIVNDTGRRLWRGQCASDPEKIELAIRRHGGNEARIGIETGPMTPWLVHELRGRGLEVTCLDARHGRAALKMQINKTDQRSPLRRKGKTSGLWWPVVGAAICPASDLAMSRRGAVWEFADRFQITFGVLDAQWGTRVFPIPSRRLLRHTLLRVALRPRGPGWLTRPAPEPADAAFRPGEPTRHGPSRLAKARVTSILGLETASVQATMLPVLRADWPAGHHGTGSQDKQAADSSLSLFRGGAKLLLAAGRFLQRPQPEPNTKIAPGAKVLGCRHKSRNRRGGNRSHAGDRHQSARDRIGFRTAVDLDIQLPDLCIHALNVVISTFRMARALSGTEEAGSSISSLGVCVMPRPR